LLQAKALPPLASFFEATRRRLAAGTSSTIVAAVRLARFNGVGAKRFVDLVREQVRRRTR
jgi:hypothetical protein